MLPSLYVSAHRVKPGDDTLAQGQRMICFKPSLGGGRLSCYMVLGCLIMDNLSGPGMARYLKGFWR